MCVAVVDNVLWLRWNISLKWITWMFDLFVSSPDGPAPPEPKWSDEPSKVHHLTKDTFSEFIESNNKILVMYYAPWCPHCKKAKADFILAADVLADETDKLLAAVDCTDTGGILLLFIPSRYFRLIFRCPNFPSVFIAFMIFAGVCIRSLI